MLAIPLILHELQEVDLLSLILTLIYLLLLTMWRIVLLQLQDALITHLISSPVLIQLIGLLSSNNLSSLLNLLKLLKSLTQLLLIFKDQQVILQLIHTTIVLTMLPSSQAQVDSGRRCLIGMELVIFTERRAITKNR